MSDIVSIIGEKTQIKAPVVQSIIGLIKEGNTIPFIARYRKEMTDGASDEQLREFEEIYLYQQKLMERKEEIIRLMTEKEVLTPELEKAVHAATTLSQLDDIYRPFKDKKNTRATKAIAKWLQPLADVLLACTVSHEEFIELAKTYINHTDDLKTAVNDEEEAIQGAMDIVAETIADHPELRAQIKDTQWRTVLCSSKATKNFEENSVYETYKEYSKSLSQIANYAYLALCRAENEKQLRIKITFKEASSVAQANKIFVAHNASDLSIILKDAIVDGIKRLLHPSLERELRSAKKEKSDREAIDIFGKNVEELLLSSPVKGKTILGFDPAYRTWCKLAVIDHTGKYLASEVIYPTRGEADIKPSKQSLLALIKKYNIGLICIGNGTASRESEQFVAELIKENALETKYLVVSEAGASVYSASKLATQEYPDLDVTIRGAINIAQRVQDPLSTYVKIDPKSLGVGQYQHDVDQKLLKAKLENHIEDAVNSVGVELNTASWPLLQHIAWLSQKTAQNIVGYREKLGSFSKRSQIKKVPGLGPKAFEQCAGFLRIRDAKEPLDSTWIHPESYKTVYEILENECKVTKKSLTLPYSISTSLDIVSLSEKYTIGEQTLQDIISELANPWLDPREDFDEKGFRSDVLTMEDLTIGMKVQWVVRNITDFGAFVDIWLKNDGLVHKSQISDTRVANVFEAVSIWQQLEVSILEVDLKRKRVSLSAKTGTKQARVATSRTNTARKDPIKKVAALSDDRVEESKGSIVWK